MMSSGMTVSVEWVCVMHVMMIDQNAAGYETVSVECVSVMHVMMIDQNAAGSETVSVECVCDACDDDWLHIVISLL